MREPLMSDDSGWYFLDDVVERFEGTWRRQGVAELKAFVPAPDVPHRQRVLMELVKVDQELRWAAGQPRMLEEYLREWPELADSAGVLLALLESECRTRAALGSLPTRAELDSRFPKVAGQLDLDGISARVRSESGNTPVVRSAADLSTQGPSRTPLACEAAPRLAVGQAFGPDARYTIQGVLGEGGMGVVYRARDELLQRDVALKMPRLNPSQNADLQERFKREFQAAARLRHPHICQIYDAGQWQGNYYVTMELIEGVSLADWSRNRTIAPREAAELVGKISGALAAVHEVGIIHRDIKPGNVMIDADGQPRLMDFGLARLVQDGEDGEGSRVLQAGRTPAVADGERDLARDTDRRNADGTLTSPGALVGTVAFMSPEQTLGQKADERSDVYSVGVLLYQLLTGRCPFQGSIDEMLRSIRKDTPPSPRSLRPGLPRALEAICLRAMAKHPQERHESAQQLAAVLQGYAERSRRRPLWLVAAQLLGLLAGLVLLGVIVVRIFHREGPPTDITLPEGSRLEMGPDGKVLKVWPPGAAGQAAKQPTGQGTGAAKRTEASQAGWRSSRCDLSGSGYYPFPSTRRTGHTLVPYPWQPAARSSPVSCVRTADLDGDGYLELAVVEGDTLAVYDRWGREAWRQSPASDSQLEIPAGRVPQLSEIELIELGPADGLGIVVLAGSSTRRGWCQKAPMKAVLYAYDGRLVHHFPVLDGMPDRPDRAFDFNGDGRVDIVFATGAYRHPHAVCIYDAQTGESLWRADLADAVGVGGVGDVDGDAKREILVIGVFDCHVDPPVGDYDSDHCYVVLFDAKGQRRWKQTYQHALDGLLADLDGNGTPEIVLIHDGPEEGNVHILDPATGRAVASLGGLHGKTQRAWAAADLTGDGRSRQLVLGDGRQLLVIESPLKIRTRVEAPEARVLAANDLDGDGRVEVVVCQGLDLVVFDGALRELARHPCDGMVQRAIISDLDADGVNEIFLLVGDGGHEKLEVVHFQPESAEVLDRNQPVNVVVAYLEAQRAGKSAEADALVRPERREAVREKAKTLLANPLPSPLRVNAATHVDDAVAELVDQPGTIFRLRFVESQWWITEVLFQRPGSDGKERGR